METLKEKANHSMGEGGGREEEGRQIMTGGKGWNKERKWGEEKRGVKRTERRGRRKVLKGRRRKEEEEDAQEAEKENTDT